MSEVVSNATRDAVMQRQTDFHHANKANLYLANKGDYGNQSVTPWVGNASSNNKSLMNLSRWQQYDGHILDFKDNEMLAEMWFFADDSSFGSMSLADQQRLIRYGMARTSAFSHTSYVMALEWQEGFSASRITQLGSFTADHNPWDRLLSVHSTTLSNWQFAADDWPTFIATQAGNSATAVTVNNYGLTIRSQDTLPHIDEEYGILIGDVNNTLRGNLWANLASGAAGGGTGSGLESLQRFLEQSGLPFQSMSPNNSLVSQRGSARFALAEADHHYLIYHQSGSSLNVDLTGSNLMAQWFNPRDPNGNLGTPFAVSAGNDVLFTPPNGLEDWVLWITDGTNLNAQVTHPTGNAQLIQQFVGNSDK
jgi:hypothetical protein